MRQLILIFNLLSPLLIFCQSYIPIPTDNAEWIVEGKHPDGDGGSTGWSKTRFYVKGDTIINDTTYVPVFIDYRGSIDLYTYLFQDTIKEKVYYTNFDLNNRTLLYDFNLQVGDTLLTRDFEFQVVDKIDSVIVHGEYRKRIYFHDYLFATQDGQQLCYIEGVGSNSGLFPSTYLSLITSVLTCFKFNNETVYPINVHEYGCDLNVIVIKLGNDELNLTRPIIFPNPFQETIKINSGGFSNVKIKIFNLQGVLIISTNIQNDHETVINLSQLNRGTYIYRVESEDCYNIAEGTIVKTK